MTVRFWEEEEERGEPGVMFPQANTEKWRADVLGGREVLQSLHYILYGYKSLPLNRTAEREGERGIRMPFYLSVDFILRKKRMLGVFLSCRVLKASCWKPTPTQTRMQAGMPYCSMVGSQPQTCLWGAPGVLLTPSSWGSSAALPPFAP